MAENLCINPLPVTERLRCIAGKVRKGSVAADIGTDHAYLPIHLAASGICEKVIACDIGTGPLLRAARNIKRYGLEKQIELVLSDGLKRVHKDVQDIIISGMGGELIAQILEASPWVRDKKYNLILQPMTKKEKLRKYLFESGFDIYDEQLCRENGRLYVVISASFAGACTETQEVWTILGKKLFEKRDPLFPELINLEIKKLEKKLRGLSKSQRRDSREIEGLKRLYEDMLNIKEEWDSGASC